MTFYDPKVNNVNFEEPKRMNKQKQNRLGKKGHSIKFTVKLARNKRQTAVCICNSV